MSESVSTQEEIDAFVKGLKSIGLRPVSRAEYRSTKPVSSTAFGEYVRKSPIRTDMLPYRAIPAGWDKMIPVGIRYTYVTKIAESGKTFYIYLDSSLRKQGRPEEILQVSFETK